MREDNPVFPIVEVFGFPHDNDSPEATCCRAEHHCPFIDALCIKGGHDVPIPLGTCTVTSKYGPIITCPKRFYADTYAVVDQVAAHLFEDVTNVVKIPEVGLTRKYSFDWILAKYGDGLRLLDYHGVEVQAIDITGSVRPYFEAFLAGKDWHQISHLHGINWANVFKRMLPQILAKGAMLASYGKRLSIVIQDQLLAYIQRSERMSVQEEPNKDLANMLFFPYRLVHNIGSNTYQLELAEMLPSSSRRLETAFIAGLLGKIPIREEFDRIVADKMAGVIESQNSGG